jgi:carbamoyl-phosphate synthase large subunit
MLGKKPRHMNGSMFELDHVGVKAAQFSFHRLKGADPITGVEMASTGEVGCLGTSLDDALLKALLSIGFSIPKKSILVSVNGDKNRFRLLPELQALAKKGFEVFATDHTAEFLEKQGIKCKKLFKLHEKKEPNISTFVQKRLLDLVVCAPDPAKQIEVDDEFDIRRNAIDYNIPLITNVQLAKQFFGSMLKKSSEELEIMAWDEYFGK